MSTSMTLVLGMELQKYFLNTDPHFKSKFAVRCKPCYRSSASSWGGKSGQYRAMHPAISGGISTNAER